MFMVPAAWVVTRPTGGAEADLIPHYFMARLDADTRMPQPDTRKVGFRDVSSASNERTLVAASIPSHLPCNHKTPTFTAPGRSTDWTILVALWLSSFTNDYLTRITGGNTTLSAIKGRPSPSGDCSENPGLHELLKKVAAQQEQRDLPDDLRALIDAVMAEFLELTPYEYAYILSTFPLLDRDQPPLPQDYRIRPTNKGIKWRRISFITRDLALLTYFDYLAGRLDVQPDPGRIARVCPDGVPDPPTDIVDFFAEAGVDIGGRTEYAVSATGPFRDLRERVAQARELGAVAYVPTIDRRRATFVERAAAAGGLSPNEGVLTTEMAKHVLKAKADRDEKWARAMELWEQTPNPRAERQIEPVAAVAAG